MLLLPEPRFRMMQIAVGVGWGGVGHVGVGWVIQGCSGL